MTDGRHRDAARGIQVRAIGKWSPLPPPYLSAISDLEFSRLKAEWLKRIMMIGSLVPSHRVIAFFMTDYLNWATMDCWLSHDTLAGFAGTSSKTVQRTTSIMEGKNLLAVYRRPGSSQPLRYAPVYLMGTPDSDVGVTGHRALPKVDIGVHQSLLLTPFESSVRNGLPKEESKKGLSIQNYLSFNLAERGRYEREVASLLGGMDVLLRLAAIHDDIVTRICEA